ncbi:alpha/beta hydrolase [Actinomadura physcomitrii]|nr:alpha/beta fold hydrolase [Actinomadura physcomitrii]
MASEEVVFPVELSQTGKQRIAGTVFAPPVLSGNVVALVAVPGGTYDRSYWDLHVPGLAGYSFVEAAVARGCVILALDNLGTGASSRPEDADKVTAAEMAEAVAHVAKAFAAGLGTGAFAGLAPQPDVRMRGVGHSLGGLILTTAQANHRPFERIAVLGTSFVEQVVGGSYSEDGQSSPSSEEQIRLTQQMAGASWESGYLEMPREMLRPFFHAEDVPDEVLRAEEAGVTVLPRHAAIDMYRPGLLAPVARKVEVPVFLAYSDADVSANPAAEVAEFAGSRDVTLFRLPGSAHCHNAATTREVLWDRLLLWVAIP